LQGRVYLENLLGEIVKERDQQTTALARRVPMLVKLAPDLTAAQLDDALEAITHSGVDGVIATNTTVSRTGLDHPHAKEQGGLSGAPLRERSTQMITEIYRLTNGELPIVGVGGIMSPDDAAARLDAGATLVQIYTGLIYAGPVLTKKIVEAL
jgi:dihydroorotate dehydrogenase